MILLDILVFIICILTGNSLRNFFSIFDRYDKNLLKKIFWYHLAASIVFYLYITNFGGDAEHYWVAPKSLSFENVWNDVVTLSRPTEIMLFLNFFPSNVLGLSFFIGNIIYGVIGYSAIVYFLALLKSLIPNYRYLRYIKVFNISIFPLLLFLPNLHFWSAGVGKDALLFFFISQFTYSLLNMRKRFLGFGISVFLSFLLRPHITFFLFAGFGVAYTLVRKMPFYKRTFLILLFSLTFGYLFVAVLSFVKLEQFTTEKISDFSDKKVKALAATGGSTVDITSYPYPLKVVTFLYRPIFFDINNPIAIFASFENLLLIILTIKFLIRKPIKTFKQSHFIIKGSFIFFMLGTLAFSLILGNLGIMLRQKNMLMLMFFLVVLHSFYLNDILPKLKSNNGI